MAGATVAVGGTVAAVGGQVGAQIGAGGAAAVSTVGGQVVGAMHNAGSALLSAATAGGSVGEASGYAAPEQLRLTPEELVEASKRFRQSIA